MDIFWLVLGTIIILIGLVGSVAPVIPGPVTSFIGLLLCLLSNYFSISEDVIIALGVIAVIITVVDYLIPIYGTKKFGGTKAGVIGTIVGLIAGIIFLPGIGIIIGPFIGAFIGEMLAGSQSEKAFKAALGSFIGFLAGTFMKLIYSLAIIYYYVAGLV